MLNIREDLQIPENKRKIPACRVGLFNSFRLKYFNINYSMQNLCNLKRATKNGQPFKKFESKSDKANPSSETRLKTKNRVYLI